MKTISLSRRPQLYLITPPSIEPVSFARELDKLLSHQAVFLDRIACLQLRLKSVENGCESGLSREDIQAGIDALLPVCRAYRLPLILNDEPQLAVQSGCDGAHIGLDDLSWHEARRILGTQKILGISCYDSLERARRAVAAGADYVAFGAFFPSPTKPAPQARVHADILECWCRESTMPAAAIGGVSANTAPALARAGAAYLCASSAIWDSQKGRATALGEFCQALAPF